MPTVSSSAVYTSGNISRLSQENVNIQYQSCYETISFQRRVNLWCSHIEFEQRYKVLIESCAEDTKNLLFFVEFHEGNVLS
ncbi:hypothetical protein F2P81_005587 [Scophthalmus maximus]|uniref:Uncharacterized protein n=1 Tax=Scophthalmus maximus TaxID=52904 RepID=A0A6A4TA25_SCOMX|nr:hypothetical protein F2P81_005587 [Scophthalmus maximus]